MPQADFVQYADDEALEKDKLPNFPWILLPKDGIHDNGNLLYSDMKAIDPLRGKTCG